MLGEMEAKTTNGNDPPPLEGGEEQKQEESQRSTSDGSTNEGEPTNNEDNKKHDNGEESFVVDAIVTAKFDSRSRVTSYLYKDAMFPQSRKAAKKVSESRSMHFGEKIVRLGNGKHALNVKTPLKLRDELGWLVMIRVEYDNTLKGIVYDPQNNTVTCYDPALSTICKGSDGVAALNPADVEKIDELLANYLKTLIRCEKNTKSAEGEEKSLYMSDVSNLLFIYTITDLLEELEQSRKYNDDLTSEMVELKEEIKKLKSEKKEMRETINQLKANAKSLGENNVGNNAENAYRMWCDHKDRFVQEQEQERQRMQQQQCQSYTTQNNYHNGNWNGNSNGNGGGNCNGNGNGNWNSNWNGNWNGGGGGGGGGGGSRGGGDDSYYSNSYPSRNGNKRHRSRSSSRDR